MKWVKEQWSGEVDRLGDERCNSSEAQEIWDCNDDSHVPDEYWEEIERDCWS